MPAAVSLNIIYTYIYHVDRKVCRKNHGLDASRESAEQLSCGYPILLPRCDPEVLG